MLNTIRNWFPDCVWHFHKSHFSSNHSWRINTSTSRIIHSRYGMIQIQILTKNRWFRSHALAAKRNKTKTNKSKKNCSVLLLPFFYAIETIQIKWTNISFVLRKAKTKPKTKISIIEIKAFGRMSAVNRAHGKMWTAVSVWRTTFSIDGGRALAVYLLQQLVFADKNQ